MRHAQLAIQPCEPVVHRLLARSRGLQGQRLQRKSASGAQIAGTVLVMDGQRLCGLPSEVGRASRQFQEKPPGSGRLLVPAFASAEYRIGPQGLRSRETIISVEADLPASAEGRVALRPD